MRHPLIRRISSVSFGLLLFCSGPVLSQDSLPRALILELRRLEETWNVLDQFAAKVWPGWSNYADVPFLFDFPDGRKMLVGHPSSPQGFSQISGPEIRGKKVFVDHRAVIPLKLTPPLMGGGGPVPFGNVGGRPVTTVHIHLTSIGQDVSTDPVHRHQFETENQILLYLHELFHCYQATVYTWRAGNLRYNTDQNYAAYAEVEGLTLEKAYRSADTMEVKEFLKDFIVARELKRHSMDSTEQLQESEQEMMEGLATYSEMRILELVKTGYKPGLNRAEDPFFYNFEDADSLFQKKMNMLRTSREATMIAAGKSYSFGGFQALILNRFLKGWQNDFYQQKRILHELIAGILHMSGDEKHAVAQRLKERYGFAEIFERHSRLIKERDEAYEMIQSRKGVVHIVNFKKTNDFPGPRARGRCFTLGLMNIFPEGIDTLKIEDVFLTGKKSPVVVDQLYYLKWVDTEAPSGDKGYELTYSRKEGESVFYDAVYTTRGFILRAPKIEVIRSPNRVKVTVLSKVKG